MIESIEMKNCAAYDCNGIKIDGCQKINFLYGANGSGKSTISNFLLNQSEQKFSNCCIMWKNSIPLDIVVYNKKFREQNFKENIAGIFTLGQATIEEKENLEKLKERLQEKQKEYSTREETLQKTKNSKIENEKLFNSNVWKDIFKKNDTSFKDAFTGVRNNSANFANKLLDMHKNFVQSTVSREELQKKAKALFSTLPEKYDLLDSFEESFTQNINEIEKNSILSKVIIGNKDIPISKLIEKLDNSDWVNQGRKYLQENEICPFCQSSTINGNLREQLHSFFSGEFEKDINIVKSLIEKYEILFSDLISYESIIIGKIKLLKLEILDFENLTTQFNSLKDLLGKNIFLIGSKLKEPSKKIELQNSTNIRENILNIIISINAEIIKNNELVDNYVKEKGQLVNDVWSLIIGENKAFIDKYCQEKVNLEKSIEGLGKNLEKTKKEIESLDIEIIEKGKNITSIQPTVDQINRYLKTFGFTNFKIEPATENNCYQLKRENGELATETLTAC